MRKLLLIAAMSALAAGAVNAQTMTSAPPAKKPGLMSRMMGKMTTKTTTTSTAAAPATTTSTHTTKAVATTAGGKPRTAQSIACSEKANTQNIHGKDREKFMRSCKKGG